MTDLVLTPHRLKRLMHRAAPAIRADTPRPAPGSLRQPRPYADGAVERTAPSEAKSPRKLTPHPA